MSKFWQKMQERLINDENEELKTETMLSHSKKQTKIKEIKVSQKIIPENNNQTISAIDWFGLFLTSFFIGVLGGFITGFSSARMTTSYYVPDPGFVMGYFLGLILIAVAIFIGAFALKEMIAEAFVRAMEVYTGKKRVINNISKKDTGTSNVFSWGE